MEIEAPEGGDGASDWRLDTSSGSFLDAGACLELLGSLYPMTVSMLYFQLESFLRRADSASSVETSIPGRLLEHNRSTDRRRGDDGIPDLLELDVDVVVVDDCEAQTTAIEFLPYAETPGLTRPRAQRRVMLQVRIQGEAQITRQVSVPLQVLMTDWGPIDGYQGFRHCLTFVGPDGLLIEEWHYVGVAEHNWLQQMDDHDREIRSGTNRRFIAAWRDYVGAAHVLMASELVRLGASEGAILAWEEREVDKCLEAGNCLNLAPGGLKGMSQLHAAGFLRAARVPVVEREEALETWAHRPETKPHVASVPHMLGVQWCDNGFHLKFAAARGDHLTPSQVVDIRRLAGDRQNPEVIAAAVGAKDIDQVKRVLAGEVQVRARPAPDSNGLH